MLLTQLLLLATAAFLWSSAYVFIGMALKGRASIRNARRQLQDLLDENPSLRGSFLEDSLPKAYKEARERASEETTIYLDNFP